MSCGCGGSNKLPLGSLLRMEAAKLAIATANGQTEQFDAMAKAVYVFITTGLSPDELERKPEPVVAKGSSPDAVVARNALLNQPLRELHTMPDTVREHSKAGGYLVGQLAQMDPAAVQRLVGMATAVDMKEALDAIGLDFAMSTAKLHAWVTKGPQ